MLFTSLHFAILLVITILAVKLAPARWRRWILLLASWAFYAGWEPKWLLLLWISTGVDYVAGRLLERDDGERTRRAVLAASLVVNLGILFAFKYWDFALALVGLGDWASVADRQSFHVYGDVPPGLSFYTFQTLSYTIDVYRRRQKAVRDPVDFALYVAFFPQLVAGPILRASEFFPQLDAPPPPSAARTWAAIELFGIGLFKKVVVADNLGRLVDPIYADPAHASGVALAIGALLFWGQVYADFSGYSTMARGLGKLFGVDLPRNFDYPLLATGPLEYRRSWHMTMSTWFRDYVFHPLGGARAGPWRAALNIGIVWTLFGLWHGAGFTFAAWGLYNGVIQAITREYYRRFGAPRDFWGKPVAGWALNLSFVVPSAVVFRCASLADAGVAYQRIFTLADGGPLPVVGALALVGLGAVHLWAKLRYDENRLASLGWPARAAILVAFTWIVVLFGAESRPFVYFQF
ncbi:MAG: MBOAT family protein [Sandaracinaceae bacterium]|nr:MBOAT family protein [Sandaracinaceae bacterium]